ncbi:MAG: hypothetical protein DMF39_05010 [Verrucomicrobia bacterium]|nr:MAG: hypothetical protein DMF39_05010 [Verrucomicrobiota bacterium]
MLSGDGDQRASRTGVCVDERVSGNFRLIKRVHNIGCGIESAAVRVHVENNRRRFVALGCFYCASQKREQRGRDFTAQRHDNHVAFVDGLTRFRRCYLRQGEKQNCQPQFHGLDIDSHCVSLASLPKPNEAKITRRAWERFLRRQSSKSPPRTTSSK